MSKIVAVRLAVARNRKTNKATLEVLSLDADSSVRAEVARSKKIDKKILITLLTDKDYNVRSEARRHPKATLKLRTSNIVFGLLASSDDENMIKEVLYSNYASSKLLDTLLYKGLPKNLTTLIANNPNASRKALDFLFASGSVNAYGHIAAHPNTSRRTLDLLSLNSEVMVRLEVVKNRNTSHKTILRLMNDKESIVHNAAINL